MMGPGLLSRAEFERQVERFVDISVRIDDEWQLVRLHHGSLYMMKKCMLRHPMYSKPHDVSSPILDPKNCPPQDTTDKTSAAVPTTPTDFSHLDQHLQPRVSGDHHSVPEEQSQPTSNEVTEFSPNLERQFSGTHTIQNMQQEKPSSAAPSSNTAHLNPKYTQETDLFKDGGQVNCSSQQNFSFTRDSNSIATGTIGQDESCDDPLEMEMESDTEDESCMTHHWQSEQTLLTYEYHVVYSESYSVPVLYFNIFTPDGKLLPLDVVWSLCPQHYQAHIKENKWTTLTQQEHPLLGRPFLQLHPCHTADLMSQVTPTSEIDHPQRTYLATWLSTVGPLIGLKIAPAYIFG